MAISKTKAESPWTMRKEEDVVVVSIELVGDKVSEVWRSENPSDRCVMAAGLNV
jgi:hypothetical protein